MAIHRKAQRYPLPHRVGRTQPRQQQIRQPRSDRTGPGIGRDWRQDVYLIKTEHLKLWSHHSRML